MATDLSGKKIILASSSPRRRELFSQLGLTFMVMRPEIDEKPRPGETPLQYARRNATEKVQAIQNFEKENEYSIVVSADTIVVLGETILEKPKDENDARAMLTMLSGAEHTVITAFAVSDHQKIVQKEIKTKVKFKNLSPREISNYIVTGEPLDKAGAYGAQGLGAYFIRRIEGSYTNVIGLPMAELCDVLSEFGIDF